MRSLPDIMRKGRKYVMCTTSVAAFDYLYELWKKKNKIVLSVIVFFIALLCIFYISNRKLKFDKNKWDKVSHRFEMSDDLIQILEKKRLNKDRINRFFEKL